MCGRPEQAREDLVKLGATVAAPQPDPENWTVMIDPQRHPFCIVKAPKD
ncbi:MAG: VOC family protein [Rhodococcus sp. (in: high G+C Gram-positive bacteria)]|nr:VOC family protein [Rhodococcus sp. EPR-157]